MLGLTLSLVLADQRVSDAVVANFGPPPPSLTEGVDRAVARDPAWRRGRCLDRWPQLGRFFWFKQTYGDGKVTIDHHIVSFVIEELPKSRTGGAYPTWFPRAEPFDGGNASGGKWTVGGDYDIRTRKLRYQVIC